MEDEYLTLDQIRSAQEFLRNKIQRTPLIRSLNIGNKLNLTLDYKAELFQITGSFKIRGVFNKLSKLTKSEKDKGVVTISAGNHAKALSYAANMMNIKATVIMPDYAPKNKITAAKGFGAEVIQTPSDNLLSLLNLTIEERDLTLVHPFDDLDILAGPGTLGLEILEDCKTVETVIVPIGGGGLISGISAAIKQSNPGITIIGVEPKGANAMTRSLAANEVMTLDEMDTIADGLAAPFAGIHTLEHVKKFVDGIILVEDDNIRMAMKLLAIADKMVTEPAGAAGVAALLSGKMDVDNLGHTVCVLSGSNVDLELLKSVL